MVKRTWRLRDWTCASILLASLAGAPLTLAAQETATVEQLAPVLQAEDSRQFDAAALTAAITSADSFVRSTAALAIGRIGDLQGTDLLVRAMSDPDTTVRYAAVFGLGLLRDTAAVAPILDRLRSEPVLNVASAVEAMTTLAKIGGPQVGEIFRSILDGRAALDLDALDQLKRQIVFESWRLGRYAPVSSILPFMADTSSDMRWRATYALSQLHVVAASRRFAEALRDPLSYTRIAAIRAFTPAFADSAGLGRAAAARLIEPLLVDDDAGVRIAALRGLAALGDTSLADQVRDRLGDQQPGVRIVAATALGALRGTAAASALSALLTKGSFFALDQAALLALAHADTAVARPFIVTWSRSNDWTARMAAAEAMSAYAGRPSLVDDADSRVVAAALTSWAAADSGQGGALLAAARQFLRSRDAAVRAVAAGIVGRAHDVADIDPLADAYARAGRDSFPDAAIGALEALRGIAASGDAAHGEVSRRFLARVSRPADYVIRAWAEASWPEAAARWGPAYPLVTGRTLQDYREIVRRYLVGPDSLRRPHVTIETEQRGNLEIALMGPEAPLTVAHFLSLVDQHAFDGMRWHRVVPDFVIQAGDPRGDGWGSVGGTIRDEINPVRYLQPVLGMALSGPDTGSSQWFINLSPQPHLDGTYTVFGTLVGNYRAITRITQGDRIRTVRR